MLVGQGVGGVVKVKAAMNQIWSYRCGCGRRIDVHYTSTSAYLDNRPTLNVWHDGNIVTEMPVDQAASAKDIGDTLLSIVRMRFSLPSHKEIYGGDCKWLTPYS